MPLVNTNLHDFFIKDGSPSAPLEDSTNVEVLIPLEDRSSKARKIRGMDTFQEPISSEAHTVEFGETSHQHRPTKISRIEFDATSVVRDPGLRKQIWDHPIADREKIRRAYLTFGPYRPLTPKGHSLTRDKKGRSFQETWYKLFSEWLEYSRTKDCVFYLQCFLFAKPTARPASGAFMVEGFSSWRKVHGKSYALLAHVGDDHNSVHRVSLSSCQSLRNKLQHIDNVIEKITTEQVAKNRLWVEVTIEVIRWLTFQGCAFRGRDERKGSSNRGNVIELIKLIASHDEIVASTVLDKAPGNASYYSHDIQNQILSVFSTKIQEFIRNEINEAKFCILVDESRDEARREQMVIVLRFVDKDGFVRERFFDIVHVSDTRSLTLKDEICKVLSRHNLNVHNMRGQGYDGASNMRGEWSGLQSLFCGECPYAYYVHCFAHRLQLALVAASKEQLNVGQFFCNLNLAINIPTSSCKRHDQLRAAKAAEIAEQLAINDDFEFGKGKNQIGTLKRPGDSRWGSHLGSICSLIKLFKATCSVISDVINDGTSSTQRAEANEFVFILQLMRELFEIADDLSQALQQRSLDIVNAMDLVRSTKLVVQQFRDDGWVPLIETVKLFCEAHDIEIPDMNACYKGGRGQSRGKKNTTNDHHFRVDIFLATCDSQMEELRNRFKEDVMELLVLSSALNPKNAYKSFNIDDICNLANKFYPTDFSEQEKLHLKYQLKNYVLVIFQHPKFQNLSSISELCQMMAETEQASNYPLVDRLIRLVLTIPVSTATSKHAFSAMKIVKTRLRNKMEDDFLSRFLITYIEKDIARDFDMDMLIEAFDDMSPTNRRAQLRMPKFDK